MGFFGDLKQDLSQAVNELLPDDSNNAAATEPEQTPSSKDFSLEDMLDNIDAFTLPEEEGASDAEETQTSGLFENTGMEGVDLESMLAEISEKEEFAAQKELQVSDETTEGAKTGSEVDEETLLNELFAAGTPDVEEQNLSFAEDGAAGDFTQEELVFEDALSEDFSTEETRKEDEETFEQFADEVSQESVYGSEEAGEEESFHDGFDASMESTAEAGETLEESELEIVNEVEPAEDFNQEEPTDEEVSRLPVQEAEKPFESGEEAIQEELTKIEDNEEEKGEIEMDSFAENRVALDETSVITAGMTVTGDIESQGSVDIVGEVNGNIRILGKLNITGHVTGNSQAGEVFAEGAKITGDINSEGSVKVGASTVIIGNITALSAAIAGAVKGDIDVRGPVILDASAIVMGNIKSKSVQINNGAVVEGMCSQCYADVSPTAFFDEYKPETKKNKSAK